MRVGCVTTSFPHGPDDHAGRFVATRVEALRAAGARVEVVALGAPGGAPSGPDLTRVPSRLVAGPGIPELLDREGLRAAPACLAATLRLVEAVRGACARWTRVESHWLVPGALAVALACPDGRPHHTAHAHSGDVALLARLPAGAALARFVLARVDHLHVVSEPLLRALRALCGAGWPLPPVTVAPMPAAALFSPGGAAPRARRARADAPLVGVGRLVPIKGFERLLLGVGRLPRARRPRVVLLGDGPERARLRGLAERVDVRLELPGFVPQGEVAARLRRARALVVASRRLPGGRGEGAPVVLREALALGVPVIAAREAIAEAAPPVVAWDGSPGGLAALLDGAVPARAAVASPAPR